MEAGLVGDVVCERRAAAAAADERVVLAARLARNACTAAVDAAEDTGGALAAYLKISVFLVIVGWQIYLSRNSRVLFSKHD